MRVHDWKDVALALLMIAMIVGGVALTVRDCNARAKCTDNGGHVVEYNCHMVCSGDISEGTFSCSEHCDWRCVGANPEAR